MTDPDALRAQLLDALRAVPAPRTVEVRTADGLNVVFYGPGPDHQEDGTLFVPACLLDDEDV